jgi:hypothetical protein
LSSLKAVDASFTKKKKKSITFVGYISSLSEEKCCLKGEMERERERERETLVFFFSNTWERVRGSNTSYKAERARQLQGIKSRIGQ